MSASLGANINLFRSKNVQNVTPDVMVTTGRQDLLPLTSEEMHKHCHKINNCPSISVRILETVLYS